MDSKLPIAAGAAAVIGILVGTLLAPSGPDMDEIREVVKGEVSAQAIDKQLAGLKESVAEQIAALDAKLGAVEGVEAQIGALSDKLTGMESAAQDLSDRVGQSAANTDIAALKSQLETVASALSAAVASSAADQAAKLEARLDDLRSTLAGNSAPAAPTPTPTAAAPVAMADGTGFGPGMTLVLDGGAARVFVSRVSDDGARLSINGDLADLGMGESLTLATARDYCVVSLDGVSGGAAQVSGKCGDDLPTPAGKTIGETFILNDSTIRVFVSRVDQDQARLGLNGALVTLGAGRTALVPMGDDLCGVTLDAVERGYVEVSSSCGAGLPLSAPIAPGGTVTLADGAARVFLSSVSDGEGTARFAVNGFDTHTLTPGGVVDLAGGCAVTLESVTDGKASFSYGCAN